LAVIPYRINKLDKNVDNKLEGIKNSLKRQEQIEILKGIAGGYLNGKDCINCNTVYSTDINVCSKCGFNYSDDYLFAKRKSNGIIINITKAKYKTEKNHFDINYDIIEP